MSRSCTFVNCTESLKEKEKRSKRHHLITMGQAFAGMEEVETLKTKIRFRRDTLDNFKAAVSVQTTPYPLKIDS